MFFLFALLIYFGGFIYIAHRISFGLNIQNPYKIYIFGLLIFLGLLSIAAFIGSHFEMPFISIIGPIGYISMGIWGIAITFFIINDIVNLGNLIFKIKDFRYYSTVITLILIALTCIWSLINAAFILRVKEVKIKVPNLSVDSLKIVQIADLHIDSFTNPKIIKKIFSKTQDIDPDIIVLTGDIIDFDINKEDKFLDYGFEQLQAEYGIYSVTGNHEYYTGVESFFEIMKKLNIKVLRNENVEIKDIINIAGINDKDFRKEESISNALANTNPDLPILFLSHQPEAFDMASEQGKSIIQLSGHTHAGQIPPISIARKIMKYNYGLYENKDSKLYITAGSRWWGPPMRLFNMSEITLLILEKE